MRKLHLKFGLLEGITNPLLVKQKAIEGVCEGNDGIVFNLILLMDAHDVLGASLLKDLTNELRVTSGDDNQL